MNIFDTESLKPIDHIQCVKQKLEPILADIVEQPNGCITHPDALKQFQICGDRKTLRRHVYNVWSGGNLQDHQYITMSCGRPNCLNILHMNKSCCGSSAA